MSQFINPTDYDASIHAEILSSLTRSDASLLDIVEGRAIAQMRSYLRSRYDCDAIFAAQADHRHPLVLMMAIDIAIYHAFSIHNPQKMSAIRRDRYDRALEWLKAVQRGELVIDGAPQLPADQRQNASYYLLRSNPKRTPHV